MDIERKTNKRSLKTSGINLNRINGSGVNRAGRNRFDFDLLTAYLFIFFLSLSFFLSFFLSLSLFCFSVCLSVRPSVRPYVCVCLCVFVCVCVCVYVRPRVYVSFSLLDLILHIFINPVVSFMKSLLPGKPIANSLRCIALLRFLAAAVLPLRVNQLTALLFDSLQVFGSPGRPCGR